MAQLSPYLHLDGTTREALAFYQSVLGGEVQVTTVGEMPGAAEMELPGGGRPAPDKVMHGTLTTGDWVLMASDMMDPSTFTKGDTYSVCLTCGSKAEIETLSETLAAGGNVFMPLEQMPFGWFTSFTDKCGVDWLLQFGSTQ
jgi:PhnB protein